jgi:hypothetical protein
VKAEVALPLSSVTLIGFEVLRARCAGDLGCAAGSPRIMQHDMGWYELASIIMI